MTIIEEPKDIEGLEQQVFLNLSDAINSPSYWIASTEEDLKKNSLILLDGEATLLVYSVEHKGINWKAYTSPGQYLYQAKTIGEGVLIFPHLFSYEFPIELKEEKLRVIGEFDGKNIETIALPMKDVSIVNFFEAFSNRLKDAFSTTLKFSTDSTSIKVSETITIPDAQNLGMKLSLMGINVKKITVISIEKLDLSRMRKEEIQEEKLPSMTRSSSVKKKRKAKSSINIQKPEAKPVTSPASPAISKPTKESIPSGSGEDMGSIDRSIETPVEKMLDIHEEEDMDMFEDEYVDMSEHQDVDMDRLIPKEMESVKESLKVRYTHATYFERMLPNRAYPLLVKITTEETGVKKSITSIVSGEKISEKEDIMIISSETNKITIRPEFPGCFTIPEQIIVDLDNKEISAKFHVTPLALGKLTPSIKFLDNDNVIHIMELETKVITHRLSRWLAIIGASASAIPAFLAFVFNQTPAIFLEERLETYAKPLSTLGWLIPIILSTIFLGISGITYKMRSPKKNTMSLSFPR